MARVKNELQSNYEFSCDLDLRISDFNIAGHVGNSQMVGLVHEARIKLLKELGASEFNLGDGKTGSVIADITVNFKAEIFPDDIVSIKSHIGDIGETGFRIYYCIESNGKPAALIETGIVAFDYKERKRAAVPKELLDALAAYKGE